MNLKITKLISPNLAKKNLLTEILKENCKQKEGKLYVLRNLYYAKILFNEIDSTSLDSSLSFLPPAKSSPL